MYSVNMLLGENIKILLEFKCSRRYKRKAIRWRATDVLPLPAIPWTIKFLSSRFLITLFCSSWIVLTTFFILELDDVARTSWRNSSSILIELSKTFIKVLSSILYCLLRRSVPSNFPPGAKK